MSNEMYILQQHKQTIKYLESEGSDPEHYQALEQRLTEFAVGRLLAHYDGAQLTVVPDQHQLLGTQHRGHHALRLRRLHTLVDQDRGELHPESMKK